MRELTKDTITWFDGIRLSTEEQIELAHQADTDTEYIATGDTILRFDDESGIVECYRRDWNYFQDMEEYLEI